MPVSEHANMPRASLSRDADQKHMINEYTEWVDGPFMKRMLTVGL